MFLFFPNSLLIDEAFAKECQRVGNLMFAISVEGNEVLAGRQRCIIKMHLRHKDTTDVKGLDKSAIAHP